MRSFSVVGLFLLLLGVSLPGLAADSEKNPAESPKSEPAKSEPAKSEPAKKAASRAVPRSQLGMSVTGTQDAPNVLYIVPWKTVDAVPDDPYVSGLLDEVFAPVDPTVFERTVEQHEQLRAGAAQDNEF